jgi:hypothetical protein
MAKGTSKSAKYYQNNPEAREKKKKYDTGYHSTPERKKYKRELAADRRKRGIMGKGGADVSHRRDGTTTTEARSTNRARNGAGGKAKRKS